MRTGLAIIAAAALTACATAEKAPVVPSFAVAPGEASPPHAALYANCIAEAISKRTYDREGDLIRFHCVDAAQAFFDGLGAYAAVAGSEITGDGRLWRFTQKMESNPYGLDYCWRKDLTPPVVEFKCTIVLNAGPFLAAQP